MYLIVRWLITAIALVIAAWLIPGIRVQDQNAWVAVAVMAAVLGLVNAFVRPLLTFLSCPLILLTLGLFLLVINAATLGLASWLAVNLFGVGFYIDGFWSALFGSIVVSIVSFVLSLVLPDERPA
ncbi:MAG: phage holin family protein [Chloroflexi bacterium]|nr:phage holin family protein [Chloroflexota bacterium]